MLGLARRSWATALLTSPGLESALPLLPFAPVAHPCSRASGLGEMNTVTQCDPRVGSRCLEKCRPRPPLLNECSAN
eukprot:5678395-Alexandrium_andersonii.AAC.1